MLNFSRQWVMPREIVTRPGEANSTEGLKIISMHMPRTSSNSFPVYARPAVESWMEFFNDNGAALFQTALLLSADPEEAELSVTAVIDSTDFSNPPAENEFSIVRQRLATQTIQGMRRFEPSRIPEARPMLQNALRPVLEIDGPARICFVLCMLLGYAVSACACMLGVEDIQVRALIVVATLQLHQAVSKGKNIGSRLA